MSNFQAPAQNPYPPAPQYGVGAQNGAGGPQLPAGPRPKTRNGLGIAAFVIAIVGFVFACIPGALIVGWVLLPIAFILGLVAIFLRGKVKWQAISAVIISVVGTIVGAMVFVGVVANAASEAFGESSSSVNLVDDATTEDGEGAAPADNSDAAPAEEAAPVEEAATADGTRENPLPLGSVIEGDEWTVTINSVDLDATDAVMGANQFNDAPAEGDVYILINYTVTYTGDDPDGQMPAMVGIDYVTGGGNTVDELGTIAVAPEAIDSLSALYNGASATGNEAIAVPTPVDGVLAVSPGMFDDKVFVAVQ